MNNCNFVGRFTADPEIRDVGNTQLVTFFLAVEEYRRDKEGNKKKRVDFFEFEAWDSGGTTIHKICKKGQIIAIHASARQQKWTNPQGESKQKINFRVQSFKIFNEKERPNDQN
jgi:single-strand DNA-binding protein|tara:strand:+ start:282 stop:623 length:342 start_codon:yes stop_codon:yes gene_type:complete